MTTYTSITSTPTFGQDQQLVQFVQQAARKAAEEALGAAVLDKAGAQLVIERGDELTAAIQDTTFKALKRLSVREDFASEEVPSTCSYGKKYFIRPLVEQIDELKKHFPELSLSYRLPTSTLSEGAEGWFAIPRWEKVAPKDSPTYNVAVERMLAAIASTRRVSNYREGQLGPERLRQSERTKRLMAKIADQQPGDILIVPAQFGNRHAGRSVRRARVVFTANEFGLGAFASGCMLLAHPDRIVRFEDLRIDCAGDEYGHPDASQPWFGAPFFRFSGDELEFEAGWVSSASVRFGASSGFLPQF